MCIYLPKWIELNQTRWAVSIRRTTVKVSRFRAHHPIFVYTLHSRGRHGSIRAWMDSQMLREWGVWCVLKLTVDIDE